MQENPVPLISEEEVAVLFGLQTVYLWDSHTHRGEEPCSPVYLNRIAYDPLGIRELYEDLGSDLAGSNCFMGVRKNNLLEELSSRNVLDDIAHEAPLLSVPNGCGGFANIRSDFFPLQVDVDDMYVSSEQYWCRGRGESRRDHEEVKKEDREDIKAKQSKLSEPVGFLKQSCIRISEPS